MLTFDKLCMGCMNDNGGEEICPICGHTAGTPNPQGTLPIKTRIQGRYIIGKAHEINGEGITYVGWDSNSNNVINIREFFPVPLTERNSNLSAGITSGNEFNFNSILTDFVDHYKKLRTVNAVAVPEILDILECNNTAYVILKAVPGISLREFLLRNGGTLSWEQAKALFIPLISSVSAIHKAGIIHGGISPETIMVGRDGKLRLTGFSPAHFRKSQSAINSQVFPGYAAVEQYGLDDGELSEATDVYGFASTLFRVLIGTTLPEANERINDDNMAIPAKIAESLPKPVLTTLANALQVLKQDRTQNMDDLKLDITPAVEMTTSFAAITEKPEKPVAAKHNVSVHKKSDNSSKKAVILSAAITAAILLIIFGIFYILFGGSDDSNTQSSSAPSSSAPLIPPESSSEPSEPTVPMRTVPDFTAENLTFIELCQKYSKLDLKFEVLGKKYSDKPVGTVIDQDYKAGSEVPRDTTIYVTLSLGPEQIVMPDLVGKTKYEAMEELFKAGFSYYNIDEPYNKPSSTIHYGHVISTSPAAGELVSPEEVRIVIYISNTYLDQTDSGVENDTGNTSGNTENDQ